MMEKPTYAQIEKLVVESGQHLWIATDVLKKLGVSSPSSRHKYYRICARALAKLEKEGYLHSRFFPSIGITVYWKIP
jgi:hypothetical protein